MPSGKLNRRFCRIVKPVKDIMAERSYTPISCSFYDELEALATLRQPAVIRYAGEQGKTVEAQGRIKDFFIRDRAEYLLLDSGLEIRLDDITSVNGKIMGNYC
jgi:Rho-binding antiterminator